MQKRSVAHTSFAIERTFPVPPHAVFHAWSDPEAKRSWADCHSEGDTADHVIDFRPGGSEINRMRDPNGSVFLVNTHYFDIVADERIVYAYDILANERRLSASLVSVEFRPDGNGTRMLFNEQVAFLDGYQDAGERIRGTEEGFDRLALALLEGLAPQ